MICQIKMMAWAFIRGVLCPAHYRRRCERCGFTGQVHLADARLCWRFKPERSTRCTIPE